MATLTSAAVSLYPALSAGGQTIAERYVGGVAPRSLIERSLLLVLTGQGGLTNTITAQALGLSRLAKTSVLWDKTNGVGYPAVVDPVLNILILLDGSAAPAPVDVTTTAAYVTVTGVPFQKATSPVT